MREADYPLVIPWSDAYCTGNERIDREHQRLFDCINDLEFAAQGEENQDALAVAVDFLARYAQWHFAHEEECMFRLNCPAYGVNCAAHKIFNERIQSWVNRLATGSPPLTAREIHGSAANWIQMHILKIDRKLKACDAGIAAD